MVVQKGTASELKAQTEGCYHRLLASLEQHAGGDPDDETATSPSPSAGNDAAAPVTKAVAPASMSLEQSSNTAGKGKLVKVEARHQGAVPFSTYVNYFAAFGSGCYVVSLLSLYVLAEASTNAGEWWLGKWSEKSFDLTSEEYIGIYSGIAGLTVLVIVVRSVMWAYFFVTAASELHGMMLRRIFWCPMSFFDTTPVGRILNRFSQDQNDIDLQLPTSFEAGIIVCVRCTAIVILTCIPEPLLLLGIVPLLVLFSTVREYFRRSSREAQRLQAIASSPVYSAMEEDLTRTLTVSP